MISLTLAEYLATELSITLGTDIFAESAQGDKYVLVKNSSCRPWIGMDSQFRTSNIQIVVYGYNIAEASQLSEQIVKILEPVADTHLSGAKSYLIHSVNPVGLPILTTYNELQVFSTNFSVSYFCETII